MNKKAFSMIEILISVSIIIILAIVATTTSNNLKNNSNNSKVIADLNTIENALVSFKMETNSIAMPGGNNNNFDKDGVYIHSFTSTGTYGVYGKFTENTLEKRFLDITPLDPRTNQYYSYGITKDTNNFELAGVIGETDNFVSKVVGDYEAKGGIHSLIREYNGPNFISDKSTDLPYNPNERVLIATDSNWNVYKKGDTINNDTGGDLEIFFSDGSTSLISPGTIITLSELDFPKENNLVSKVNLFLQAGSIWTKATKLDNESSFDIYTSDMTASVRGTIFKVEIANDGKTEVTVLEGKVEVSKGSINDGEFEVSEVLDTLEVNELPDGTLENTEVIDSVNETPTNYTPVIDSDNMGFSHTLIINTLVTEPIKDTPIIKDIQETYEPKNCYLEGVEIENGKSGYGYLTNKNTNCESVSNKQIRTCNDGVLSGNTNYKYAGCSAPDKCSSVDNGDILPILKAGDTAPTITKQIDIIGGTKELTKTVTCNNDLQLSVSEVEAQPICNTSNGFTLSSDKKSCECVTGKIYDSVQNKCIINCTSGIYIGGVCQDETIPTPALTGWILNGVMPYDEKLNFKMYKNGGIINATYTTSALSHVSTDLYLNNKGWTKQSNSNFYTKTGINGIFLDTIEGTDFLGNIDTDDIDYLKYGHYSTTNFGIEMNVFVPQTGLGARFLAQLGDLKIYIDNNSKLFVKYGGATVYAAKTLNIHQMNKILLLKEGNKYKLFINDIDIGMINSSTTDTSPHLFIGSDSDKGQPFNSIIDYVKIYTK